MTRTSMAQLDACAELIDSALDKPKGTHTIQRAYGQPRLMAYSGSHDVSPRLPAGELAAWLRAYLDGIYAGKQAGYVRGRSDERERIGYARPAA